jgi:hypothetical protein
MCRVGKPRKDSVFSVIGKIPAGEAAKNAALARFRGLADREVERIYKVGPSARSRFSETLTGEFPAQQIVDHFGIRLAPHRLHRLTDEKAK